MTYAQLITLSNELMAQALGDVTNVAISMGDYVNREYVRLCVELNITRSVKQYTLVTGSPFKTFIKKGDLIPIVTGGTSINPIACRYVNKYRAAQMKHREYEDVRIYASTTTSTIQNGTPENWGYDEAHVDEEFAFSPAQSNADISLLTPVFETVWVYSPNDMSGTGSPDALFPPHLHDVIAISASCEALRAIRQFTVADNMDKELYQPKLKLLTEFLKTKYYRQDIQRFGERT